MNKSATIGWITAIVSNGVMMHASRQERDVKREQIAVNKGYASAEEWRKNSKSDFYITDLGLYLKDSMINGMISLTIGASVEQIAKKVFNEI